MDYSVKGRGSVVEIDLRGGGVLMLAKVNEVLSPMHVEEEVVHVCGPLLQEEHTLLLAFTQDPEPRSLSPALLVRGLLARCPWAAPRSPAVVVVVP